MSNSIGNTYRVQIFGQSHSPMIGAVIEGIPAGIVPDMEYIQAFMARRAPGGALSTKRKEADIPTIISGLNEKGETCGAPLCITIANTDHRSQDYDSLKDVPRPGHADYTAFVKFGGHNDIRGGGQFSGRLTAPWCFAGALAMQMLEAKNVRIRARIRSIAGIDDAPVDFANPPLDEISAEGLACIDPKAAEKMAAAIEKAREDLDSVGGVIECFITGLPAGLGDPMFDGIENRLARALFGIPGVRGVEFGEGFAAAGMKGSEHNDPFRVDASGGIVTETNRHAGILGGITSGMPVVARIAIKPTPSISREQPSVSLKQNENATLAVRGRHDPCIVPRTVPVMEAAVACVIFDIMNESGVY
ncbi:MAG: chorismate synthase [Clostridiales bacterium]|nr:chorismate synthase [Clostridiales bacterium]